MSERVLVLGSGGREHALSQYIGMSEKVGEIACLPGNGGDFPGKYIPNLNTQDNESVAEYCENNEVGLVVVGPEDVLARGIVNTLRKKGIRTFGPTQEAAQLETSKIFSHRFMKRHDIPSPNGMIISEYEKGLRFLDSINPQEFVIKADGLASGKGVFLPSNKGEGEFVLDSLMKSRALGIAGSQVLVQEKLTGREVSYTAICHGTKFASLPLSQDYKRLKNNDDGPNTGGMGAIAPANIMSEDEKEFVEEKIILQTLRGMEYEGKPFHGVLYAGLMLMDDGPKAIEFNTRFGDPEIQTLLPLFDEDVYSYLYDASGGLIRKPQIQNLSSATVALVAKNYPESKANGETITGIESDIENTVIFHAGTSLSRDGSIMATGGRVLNVVGLGNDTTEAIDRVYQRIEGEEPIRFDGMFYRDDIGSNL